MWCRCNIFCGMICGVKMFGETSAHCVCVRMRQKCFLSFYYENISVLCCTTLYLYPLVYISKQNVVGVNIYIWHSFQCCHPLQKLFLITQFTHDWCDYFYTLICYNVISVELVDVTSEGLILLLMQYLWFKMAKSRHYILPIK